MFMRVVDGKSVLYLNSDHIVYFTDYFYKNNGKFFGITTSDSGKHIVPYDTNINVYNNLKLMVEIR